MYFTPDLRILFPTSYSDACFRASAAIAQLAGICDVHLTIAHVVKPGESTIARRRELDSFFAEADHYQSCRRTLVEADDAAEAIARLCNDGRFDLVAAPASDRSWFSAPWGSSFRARLMERCEAPVWTVGHDLDHLVFKNAPKVICYVTGGQESDARCFEAAAAFAGRFGAQVRVLNVLPSIHEGMLARDLECEEPLMPEPALDGLRRTFGDSGAPEVEIAVGDPARELPRMVRKAGADLVFLGPGQALRGGLWSALRRAVDRIPCPVIAMDGACRNFSGWTFSRQRRPVFAFETTGPLRMREGGLREFEDVRFYAPPRSA